MSYNRNIYYSYIERELTNLASSITRNGKVNLLNLHVFSEDFYKHFFNLLFNFNLDNLNEHDQNAEAVDLIDRDEKIILQVSSTCTKDKVQKSIDKLTKEKYDGYTFRFISIAKDADDLREQTFSVPAFIKFDPKKDIYDVNSILKKVKSEGIDKMEEIFDFIAAELSTKSHSPKFDSNIASIINILSQENLTQFDSPLKINKHDIDQKIELNKLKDSKRIINQYAPHFTKVDRIYTEYDKSGANKSHSVLSLMEDYYWEMKNESNGASADNIFQKIKKKIVDKVTTSANYQEIPIDELYLCVKVLMVDAFIRCKIFEDPTNYNYAAT